MNMEWKRCLVVDGVAHPSVEAAQISVLTKLLPANLDGSPSQVAGWIVEHKADVLNALTLSEKSRPGARGKTKKRSNGVTLRNVPAQADLVLQKDA